MEEAVKMTIYFSVVVAVSVEANIGFLRYILILLMRVGSYIQLHRSFSYPYQCVISKTEIHIN